MSNRAFIEALICGESGDTGYTMTAGRFHRCAPDGAVDEHPSNAAERTIEVIESPPSEPFGSNRLNGFVIEQRALTIRIGYLYTGAGGDGAEALSEQSGPATLDAIADRASADATAIDDVLQWHANHSGSDPAIISIDKNGAPSDPVVNGDRAIVSIPYVVTAKRTTGANL